MSDELFLFLILGFIYITDCLLWVEKNTIIFVAWFGEQWIDRVSSLVIRTATGGIYLLNPFPPLGRIVCCHLMPLSISPKGICSFNYQTLIQNEAPERKVEYVLFSEIETIKIDGRSLFINDDLFCRLTDERYAEKLRDFLVIITNDIEENREGIIKEFWNKQLNYDDAKKRLVQANDKVSILRILCIILFLHLFVLAPILVIYFQMTGMLIPIATVMLFFSIQIAIRFFIMHKKLYPDKTEERISNLIKMILCPPVSIRACDLITSNLLERYNPLVIGHLFFSAEKYKKFAERILRNLKYPPTGYIIDNYANKICNWQNKKFLKVALDYIRDVANIKEGLLSSPAPSDIGVHSFCPRCLSEFTQEVETCPDCPGVKLSTFHHKAPGAK